jgi:hypothetical protein
METQLKQFENVVLLVVKLDNFTDVDMSLLDFWIDHDMALLTGSLVVHSSIVLDSDLKAWIEAKMSAIPAILRPGMDPKRIPVGKFDEKFPSRRGVISATVTDIFSKKTQKED